MPQTAIYQFPYPALADPADVPTDMQNLAARIEVVFGTKSARVFRTTAFSLVNAGDTAVSFDGERWDLDNIHDNTNPTRLTCRTAGTYVIGAQVVFAVSGGGNQRRAKITLNGTGQIIGGSSLVMSTAIDPHVNPSGVWNMVVGDYVELVLYQDSGSAMNIVTLEFWMTSRPG